MAKSTRGGNAQFTYDFGIAIAQSTLTKITRLTGVTLSLASAYYALKTTASEYVDTLRENTLRFGGMLSTMQAMQQAQDRLITGMSRFDVRDQMAGMNQLMAAGVDVKKNMAWIEKAAHATGKSFEQFSGMIASAVQGNLQGLVDAGLMTQRATRAFTRFQGNTRTMQRAIINFLKQHKGLMSAIKNDFTTIGDGIRRLKAVTTSFMESIIGKPNDPGSLYGSLAKMFNMIADKFGKGGVLSQNMIMLRQYGEGVGVIMSWVVQKVGEVMIWLGRQAKKAMVYLLGDSETFAERMRSLVVWLEFWKLKIVDFFKEYSGAIKGVLKLVIAYKALKTAFIISDLAINSVWAFYKAIKSVYLLQLRYMAFQGPYIGRTARFFQSLAAWMPRPFRKAWVASGKFLSKMYVNIKLWAPKVKKIFKGLGKSMVLPFKGASKAIRGIMKTLLSTLTVPTYAVAGIFQKGAARGQMFSFMHKGIAGIKAGLKGVVEGFSMMIAPLKTGFSGLFTFIRTGLSSVATYAVSLGKGLRALWTALNATNPVGWIILALSLLTMLYSKSEKFRKGYNLFVKYVWERLKFIWNLLYGAFVYITIGIKSVYRWFISHIVNPVKNFFKGVMVAIKVMWMYFMNTRIGKFLQRIGSLIDKYIISPLKGVFEWIVKAWNNVMGALAKAVKWLVGANNTLSKNINELAKENNLPEWALAGGNYDYEDSTDYLKEAFNNLGDTLGDMFGGKGGKEQPINPLIPESRGAGASGGTTNNISLSNGAIQIILPPDADIDEAKLAKMVREEIRNLDRTNRMRGGNV